MLKTPGSVDATILEFCRAITNTPPVFIAIRPDPLAKALDCFFNVERKVTKEGGRIQFGWAIWQWSGVMIEAEHHAVFEPEAGSPWVDVTPGEPGESRRLFLPDDSATYHFQNAVSRHKNIRKALTSDPLVRDFILVTEQRDELRGQIKGLGEATLTGEPAEQYASIAERKDQILAQLAIKYTGRNEQCFCGSGKKFKRCHGIV